jgi:hypothetical protein
MCGGREREIEREKERETKFTRTKDCSSGSESYLLVKNQ